MYIIRKIHNIDHLNASLYILYSKMLKIYATKKESRLLVFIRNIVINKIVFIQFV